MTHVKTARGKRMYIKAALSRILPNIRGEKLNRLYRWVEMKDPKMKKRCS